MTDHLPECPRHADRYAMAACICPALRACEQRVLAEREADGPWFRSVVHECCIDKQTAYAAGLDAAREAVVKVYDMRDQGPQGWNLIHRSSVLAAIDGLRGES